MVFKKFANLIMIEQTLFALPFAYIGILFAGGGEPMQWLWATIALVSARTAGMSFNRVLDAEIDRKNPRTENRAIPKGEIKKRSVWILGIISSLSLIGSSYMLNKLCFYLSFLAVLLLFTYSLFKRFSASSHFYLGFVEAAAPIGGYLAVKAEFDYIAFIPGIAILFWIAGLDILYSIQDIHFDKKEGLFSIPSRFGEKNALFISALSYILSCSALVFVGLLVNMGIIYWLAITIIAIIFIQQQRLVRKQNNHIEESIAMVFRLNRLISPIIFIGALIDILIYRNFF